MRERTGLAAVCIVVVTLGLASGPAGAVSVGDGGGEPTASLAAGGQGPSATTAGIRAGSVDAAGETLAAGASQSDCSYPVSVTDTTGTTVRLDERPDRIVALQPSDAQTLWELGVQDRVVGLPRTQYTAYLANRSGRTNVKNDDLSVNTEQVIGANPDLVLAANVTSIETVRQLRDAGITVYHFGQVTSIAEIRTNVETVGRLVGACESGEQVSLAIQSAVNAVEAAANVSGNEPRALYYFFGTTTGPGTHIHDVLTTAGAENVAATAGIDGYAQLNAEVVAQQDPEYIVYPDDATIPAEEPYSSTTAVRENQTVALNSNYISQPGPRIVVPLTRLGRLWHPNAIDAENGSRTVTGTSSIDPVGNVTTRTARPDATPASGPGFGVVTALLALVAALAAVTARRRR